MNWTTVYDFGNESLRIESMLTPISFVLIGYGMSVINYKYNQSKKRKFNIIFGICFGTFALLAGAITIPHNLSTYYDTKKLYESKDYKVSEGIVENFNPMPYTGHQNEEFSLNDIKFSYSDYDESYYGFNNTKSHGGPIDDNKKIKLSYFTKNNKNYILKIEMPK